MGNRRNYKVGDFVTLAGNNRLTGKVAGYNYERVAIRWSGRDTVDWYHIGNLALIPMTEEDILDRIMKKYHGYGQESV